MLIKFQIKKFFTLFIFISFTIIYFDDFFNCSDFYDGIGHIKLKNDINLNQCFIQKPKICRKNLLFVILDINFFRNKGCEDFNDQKKIFLKYLDKNLTIFDNFSYPRTEYWSPKKSFKNLAKLVEKNIHEVNPNNSNNSEVFISFNSNKGKVQIFLKKNKTLVNYKRKLSDKYPVKFQNVYLIYIDSLSRRQFIRKLKKTSKLIENTLYTNNFKTGLYKRINSFQFFKFHNFDGHTQGNFLPMFYGSRGKSKNKIELVKYFNEKGFITAAAHNSCNKEIFDWPYNFFKNTQFSYFDHENVAMFCDPNFEDKRNKWSLMKGKNTILRKCFYGRDSFDYIFEYILQFLEAYKTERKFFRISFGDGHEATNEVIKFIDNSLNKFLQKIFENYFDDKTAIIILSDHGAQIPGPYDILFYKEKIIEKYLGVLFIITQNHNNYTLSHLLYNQQQIITLYDIHDTLLDMINIDLNYFKYNQNDSEKRQTLFKKINGKKRNCQTYKDEIKIHCFCKNYSILKVK